MEKTDVQKKIEKSTLPNMELKSHKEKLKAVLMKQQFPDGRPKKNFWNHWVLFKKNLPALGMSIAVLILLFIQNQYTPSEVANAHEIIDKAVIIMRDVPNKDEKTEAILAALEEAQKSQNLEYLGEEIVNNKKVKNIRFNDNEDIPHEIIIRIDPLDTSSNAVTVSFSTDDIVSQAIELEVKNNQVVHPEALRENLSDKSIKKEWIKTLIRQKNLSFFEGGRALDENWKKPLRPFVESAEVMITSFGLAHDEINDVYYVSMHVYVLGKQKENKTQAQEYLDKAIQQLDKVTSRQAQNKIFLLERARKSTDLKYFPAEKNVSKKNSVRLSFIDPELRNQEIIITINLQEQSEEAVQFHAVGVNALRIEGQFKNGKIIINQKAFQDLNLNKNPYKDLILQAIIHPQNEKFYKELTGDPQFPKEFLSALESIFISSEFLIQGIPYVTKDSQGSVNHFTIAVQSFDKIEIEQQK